MKSSTDRIWLKSNKRISGERNQFSFHSRIRHFTEMHYVSDPLFDMDVYFKQNKNHCEWALRALHRPKILFSYALALKGSLNSLIEFIFMEETEQNEIHMLRYCWTKTQLEIFWTLNAYFAIYHKVK